MTRLLSTNEVAARFGLHPDTVRRLTRAGKLPAIRLCRCLRYRLEDVEAALAKAALPAAPAPGRRGKLQPA
jgi:excisionase family DNA binding protein